MAYLPRILSFRGFFDPPSLSDIVLMILPFLAPKIWTKRQRIISFFKEVPFNLLMVSLGGIGIASLALIAPMRLEIIVMLIATYGGCVANILLDRKINLQKQSAAKS